MMNSKKSLLITDISRIDYPELCDRQEANPLGLLIYFANTSVILRINIGNTGQNVEYAFQGQDELSYFFSKYYGVLVTDLKLNSKLSHLKNQSLISMDLGYYPEKETKVQGVNFELLNEELVAIQLCLSNANIFTFCNDGDEGYYSFSVPYRTHKFAFGSVFWRGIHIPLDCIT